MADSNATPAPLDGQTNPKGWKFLTGTIQHPAFIQSYDASQSDFYGCGPTPNSDGPTKIVTT